MVEKERIYEVYWEGPYEPDQKNIDYKEGHILYKIYGSHPIYGDNVLLYIGKTEQGIKKRLKSHNYWMDEERYKESTIYVASLDEFTNWDDSGDTTFEHPEEIGGSELISKIESLLIYSHQPAHNTINKNTANNSKNIRIFNTGKFGVLMPEISSLYQEI